MHKSLRKIEASKNFRFLILGLACGHTNPILVACMGQAFTDEEALQGPGSGISLEHPLLKLCPFASGDARA